MRASQIFPLLAGVVALIIALYVRAVVAGPDIAAIRTALTSEATGRLSTDVLSRKIETWYASFGHTIRIADVRRNEENGHYMMALMIATTPDFARNVRGFPGVKTPEEFLTYFLKENDLTTVPFDSRRWTQELNSAHLRYRMFKSFLADHPPIGRTKSDIEAILGPGDSRVPNHFNYSLGVSLGMGMEALFVDFILKDGTVSEYHFFEP